MAGRKIIWSARAEKELISVLTYWNNRNQSTAYSKRIVQLVKKYEVHISKYPASGKITEVENIKIQIILYYLLVYKITYKRIEILSFFDSRQNPKKLLKLIKK